MPASFARNNHYNPCFWTAYWNRDFFKAVIEHSSSPGDPRKQKVYALNLRSKTILQTTTENVFKHKNLGPARITPDSAKRFFQKHYPVQYDAFNKAVANDDSTYYINFEQVLTHLEKYYDSLLTTIKTGGIASEEDKAQLACVLVTHALRSSPYLTSRLDFCATAGIDKWEFFWLFKKALEDADVLLKPATPLVAGQWTLYRTKDHTFPLCDCPVMIGDNTVMATLSPRLLLEVNLVHLGNSLANYRALTPSKFREFQQRTIANTFTHIIFHDRTQLQKWFSLPELSHRASTMSLPSARKQAIQDAGDRVIWAMNGFGRFRIDPGRTRDQYLGF
jgi:hypothetical protein